VWEPTLEDHTRSSLAREKAGAHASAGNVASSSQIIINPSSAAAGRLTPELLILNRFGIGYPFLKAAHRLSFKYNLDAREILHKSGVISEETWLESQCLLDEERENIRLRNGNEHIKLDLAVNNLHRTLPAYSAHVTFTGAQLLFLTLSISGFGTLIYYNMQVSLLVVLMLISAFYSCVVLLRILMLARYDNRVRKMGTLPVLQPQQTPVYSVVVPLYKEANQVGDLTAHLQKLNWPKNQLDIKLICESDDQETISAVREISLPDYFELIIVPNAQPKTKPKALNFALSDCSGDYLVIYDAEDRPSPDQLREAYARFVSEDETLACLQAPLMVNNARQNWLTGLFFIEYLTLFKGILPVLASWNMPLPLGGTSNHFKMSVLKSVGAWDPYNVTEDADLGIRLVREGYRTSTISLPTFEEAPPKLGPWITQRTRWMKGWMQTILVHNRNPIRLFTDMGLRDGLIFHFLLTSIVLSTLFHPFLISFTIFQLLNPGILVGQNWLLTFGIYNLVAGYTTYCLFAALVLKSNNFQSRWGIILTIPLYWFLISIAGWRALIHLMIMPHRWEKTPHGLATT